MAMRSATYYPVRLQDMMSPMIPIKQEEEEQSYGSYFAAPFMYAHDHAGSPPITTGTTPPIGTWRAELPQELIRG